jgi:hypothetical protein
LAGARTSPSLRGVKQRSNPAKSGSRIGTRSQATRTTANPNSSSRSRAEGYVVGFDAQPDRYLHSPHRRFAFCPHTSKSDLGERCPCSRTTCSKIAPARSAGRPRQVLAFISPGVYAGPRDAAVFENEKKNIPERTCLIVVQREANDDSHSFGSAIRGKREMGLVAAAARARKVAKAIDLALYG